MLLLIAIFLLTAVIVVPVFRRLQLGSVLGYIAAGIIIGPWGLGLIPEAEGTLHFAELGIVLLLFLVGLELEPSRLWALRHSVFGLGGAQVLVIGVVLGVVAHALGLSWQPAILVGFGLAMSSTAIVLAWLGERNQLSEPAGRKTFAILLFQDLAVIPLIALLPLLTPDTTDTESAWMHAAKGVAAIAVVVIGSRLVIRPVLKLVARYGGREIFTAAALLVVIGAALIMDAIGLSMSLGAFLAGVLLADSEFRHELEADVEPFKGLLMGLFFMAVGMSANLTLLAAKPLAIAGAALGLLAVKVAVMYVIARVAGTRNDDAQRIAVWLAQGGEFAFVLFSAALVDGVLDAPTTQFLVLAVTVSMLLAPLMFVAHDRMLDRWLERSKAPDFDEIDTPGNPVIIAGYGRYGQIVSRVLRMAGVPFTAIERRLPAGRLRPPLRQQGLLRRRVAARTARIRPGARRQALRPRHRRRRGVAQDGRGRAQALSRPADPGPRPQPRASLPLARPRHRPHRARDVRVEPRRRRGRRWSAPGWTPRRRRAPSKSSADTTCGSWSSSTRCARTNSSWSRPPRSPPRNCRSCSRPTCKAYARGVAKNRRAAGAE